MDPQIVVSKRYTFYMNFLFQNKKNLEILLEKSLFKL